MQRNLEFSSYYLTGRSSPVNPKDTSLWILLSLRSFSPVARWRGSPKPSYKALHHDTYRWPQLHLWCAAFESDNWIKNSIVNTEFDVLLYTHTQTTEKCFYYDMNPHMDIIRQPHEIPDTIFFCNNTCASLCVTAPKAQVVFDSTPFPLPRSQSSVVKYAFIFNTLGSRVNMPNRRTSLLALSITVAKPASFSFQPLFTSTVQWIIYDTSKSW